MNQEVALKKFIDELRKEDDKASVIQDLNKGRHKIIQYKDCKLYCVFKRDFFGTFDKYYPSFVEKNPEYSGKAESINVDFATRACIAADKIVFLHEEGVYWQYPHLIKKFCDKYNLRRKQKVETTYKEEGGELKVYNELVYHFPKKLLQEW